MRAHGVIASQARAPAEDAAAQIAVFLSGFEGLDGGTGPLTDESGLAHTMTFNGTAVLDDAQKKSGATSLFIPFGFGSDYVEVPNHALFAFGNSEWTVEGWSRLFDETLEGTIVSFGSQFVVAFGTVFATPSMRFIATHPDEGFGTSTSISQPHGMVAGGSFFHWSCSREGFGIRFTIGGTSIGSGVLNGLNLDAPTGPMRIGANSSGSNVYRGHLDELRISNFCRYPFASLPFTPVSPFPRP